MKLLEHFHELTLHPKNAKELKGLILELAVQGKLTAKWRQENQDVEPASKLLERIKAEKARLVAEKKIKKEKVLPTIDEDEIPFELPEGWVWCRLQESLDVRDGTHDSPKSTQSDISFPLVTSKDFKNGEIDYEGARRISYEDYQKVIKRSYVERGDILFSMIGGNIGNQVVVNERTDFAIKNVALFKYYNRALTLPKYVSVFTKQMAIELQNQAIGGAQPFVSLTKLRNICFPFPPLQEQKAIVTIVDQLFKEVDQLENLTQDRVRIKQDFAQSSLHQLTSGNTQKEWPVIKEHFHTFFDEKTNIKKLRETILQLAVQGKLTAKWRQENQDVEPASKLLERIKAEKAKLVAEKKIKKEKPLPPIGEDEVPYELPEEWVWCRYNSVAELKHGHQFRKYDFVEDGIPVIKIGQCKKDGSLDLANCNYIDVERKDEFRDYLIHEDDLLMALTGGTLGKVTRVNKNYGVVVQNYRVGKFVADNRILKLDYLQVILESELFQRFVKEKVNQNAQPNIGKSNIDRIILPIPPLQEQKAIVNIVDQLMTQCDELEKQVIARMKVSEDLMLSCLGELLGGIR